MPLVPATATDISTPQKSKLYNPHPAPDIPHSATCTHVGYNAYMPHQPVEGRQVPPVVGQRQAGAARITPVHVQGMQNLNNNIDWEKQVVDCDGMGRDGWV